jgi:hypothetical protein
MRRWLIIPVVERRRLVRAVRGTTAGVLLLVIGAGVGLLSWRAIILGLALAWTVGAGRCGVRVPGAPSLRKTPWFRVVFENCGQALISQVDVFCGLAW